MRKRKHKKAKRVKRSKMIQLPNKGGQAQATLMNRKAGAHKDKRNKRKSQRAEQKIWDGWR